jgi:hypothetical protein
MTVGMARKILIYREYIAIKVEGVAGKWQFQQEFIKRERK